ncbi:Uncharacterized protein BP5553_09554 [Venustampulla echinocandica]|uniref:Serine hydrolase domain-containing protein n=1 Tax=Venustampulla echinocandica TaxID=2656787 RepID=A0A370TBC7_9HELO|nr:Uncharacterized protein BP5553_09554 [Venustampulla echinocandica]RDL31345.1 Uncharacterized protein BP5553_09554 [Venustampulla echinocandica]
MRVQLGPFVDELQSDKTASFHFAEGVIEEDLPGEYGEYFGNPPHLRFFKYEAGVEPLDILNGFRDFDNGGTPEDAMRDFLGDESVPLREDVQRMLDDLHQVVHEEGPFQGVIGYSEGATVAATLLLNEQRRCRDAGSSSTFKCAIFFAGWPPLASEGENSLLLSDQVGQIITVPTCHVIGAADPYLQGCMALFNVCDSETAEMFDHGKGHLIPRDRRTVKELADVVRKFIEKAESRRH